MIRIACFTIELTKTAVKSIDIN